MNYKFAEISNISQVDAAIKDRNEFIRVDKGWYRVFNYVVQSNATFPNVVDKTTAILRECRGLIFDVDGNVLSRRFQKFFNLGEREEVFIENVDFSRKHTIQLKLDGSMITPIFNKEYNSFRWGTKMGVTAVAMNVEKYVCNMKNYSYFAKYCHDNGLTPIFEWTSPDNRIVIYYNDNNLTLLAIRNNFTGEYMDYYEMASLARDYNIPVVQLFSGNSVSDVNEFVSEIRKLTDIEGVVLRFEDGHMIKCKAEDYVLCHKAKSYIENDRYIAEVFLSEKSDDLISMLRLDDRKRVVDYIEDFSGKLENKIHSANTLYENEIRNKIDRKTFALSYTNMSAIDRSAIFAMMDGKSSRDFYMERYLRLTNSEANYDVLKKELSI